MPDLKESSVPEVIIAKPSFPLPPRGPLILGGTVLLFIAGLVLFQKFYPQAVPLPSPSPSAAPASVTPTPPIPILIFNCPVAKNLCSSGEQITFNNSSALGYLLPAGTKILRIAPVTSSKRVRNTLYEAFVFQNKDCYLISYSFPNGAEFSTKLSSPYQRMETIGTTSSDFLTVNGATSSKKVNLILQLQKFSLDQSNDSKSCDLIKRDPKDFGSYQPVTPQTF